MIKVYVVHEGHLVKICFFVLFLVLRIKLTTSVVARQVLMPLLNPQPQANLF